MSDHEKLRDEIIEFQHAQHDLLRWKIISIGAIAALGLGFKSTAQVHLIVLSIIPFITAYCDLILRQYDLRIAAIAIFLKHTDSLFGRYEKFISTSQFEKTGVWAFGGIATLLASLLFCFLVIAIGLWPQIFTKPEICIPNDRQKVLIISGTSGMILSIAIAVVYARIRHKIDTAILPKEKQDN